MANRYWVGGTGTWDGASTANWSATSGGASGASVPVAADAVLFDASSGGGTCTLGIAAAPCLSVNLTGYTGTLDFGANKIQCSGGNGTLYTQSLTSTIAGTPLVEYIANVASTASFRNFLCVSTEANAVSVSITAGVDNFSLATGTVAKNVNLTGFSGTFSRGSSATTIYGNLTLSATTTVSSGAGIITVASSTTTPTIRCNGSTFNVPITIAGVGAIFGDNFLMGSSRALNLTSGTLDANDKNVTVPIFNLGAGTKTLTIGSGTWTITGAGWDTNTNVTGLTVSASTGTISLTSASAKLFIGGAKTWPTLNQGGAGALTIQQSNTFTNITNTVQPATITLTSGTTQTVTDFDASGTSGNLITLNASTPGSRATLSDSSGTNSVSFVDIKDISATGGAVWEAYTSNGNVDSGNNLGWLFSSSNIALIESNYELRSFTEKRRF